MAEPPDLWAGARTVTPARIGLLRAGASLATAPLLAFRLAQARARDAVHTELDVPHLVAALEAIGWDGSVRVVTSAVTDRAEYLLRPDRGRLLGPDAKLGAEAPQDLAIVVADGLSARAAQDHAAPLLAALVPALRADAWRIAPPVVVRHARVAIGDPIAAMLRARAVLVLIGERPGLSAPHSLGAYLTWTPTPTTTDADRNCVSNIRPGGLPPAQAATRIAALLERMCHAGRSGVTLKDESGSLPILGLTKGNGC